MANITTQTIRVDLSTGKVIPTAYTHQNDTARTLVFDMYNGGLPYTMTGNTVKFAYKSPIVDGAYTVITGSGMASGTVSGNKVTVTLPSEYTAISGVGMLTMIITPTSGTIRPVNIRLLVQKSADGDDVVAGASDFPDAWMDEKVYSWLDDHIDGIFTEEQFTDAVDNWLDDHPEATTTVQDGSITEAKLADALKLKTINAYVTPEMFGAVGDGETDDSSAIKDCIEKAIEDGATVAMYNNYRIANPIVINADSKKCNILVYGYIKSEAQTTIRGLINSNVLIKLKDGGLGNTNNACVNIYAGGYNNFALFANDVNGLAYQMGGSNSSGTMTNFNKVEVYGWNNMQTLRHGDGNDKQWAFGTYVNIYDYKPTSPIQFLKSNDITIIHVENLFEDDTHTKNSIEFDDCDLINIESLAIGGTGKYLGYVNDSRIHINYLFVNSEDSSSNRITEGLFITGRSVVHIDYTTSGNVPHAVIVDTLTTESGANWRPQVYMQNGFVHNPSTDKLMDTTNANSQRVGCFDEQIPLTKVHANISSFSGGYIRVGKMVFINIKMNLSAQIPSGSLQVLFNGLPPHDSNLGVDISVSSSAQMFSVSKLGESATSLFLPAGQSLSAGDNYIIGSYVAAY